MVEYYGLSYNNGMDRGYSPLDTNGNPNLQPMWSDKVDARTLGISAPPMKDPLTGLKAKIFQGANKVELGFMGKGKGSMSQGATTPEQMGLRHRRDIKELADMNKIELSVHTTVGVGNLSGFTERGFSDQEREKAMHEIKKTIDFASDTTKGGAVVVHLGEYPRAFSEEENWKNKAGESEFLQYPSESEHAKQLVVDKRTGQFVGEISKDRVVFEPKWQTAKDWEAEQKERGNGVHHIIGHKDEKGLIVKEGDWVDIDGNVIPKDAPPEELFKRRVPLWNPHENNFQTVEKKWDDFKQAADEWNREHPENRKTPAMIFYETQLDNQVLQSKGSSLFYGRNYDELKDQIFRAKKAYNEYKEMEDSIPEDKRWKLALERHFGRDQASMKLLPTEDELPTQALQRFISDIEKDMRFMHESSSAADTRAAEMLETKKNLQALEEYGKEKTAETISRAAEYAMAKSKATEKPLFISPENIFPEMYGSHPEELKEIILKSREDFAKHLVSTKKVKSEKEAKSLAEQHIKATFDMGHANTWRKYFQGTDEEFKKWLLKQVDKLTEAKIVGHIHISDNFGYDDEHLTPGHGTTPIPEIVERFKKAGVTDIIVEPAEQDFEAMFGAWGIVGKPLYGMSSQGLGWGQIEHSYFGRTAPPYFLYGDLAPSQDWQLWSGVRLE
jgi:sugar phosphate isomerase/epimerase